VLAGSAASAHASAFAPVVPHGGVVLPAGARDTGPVAGDVELHATVALRPRHAAALAAYAAGVTTPGSADYHHYLSVRQFADRFGPTTGAIATVQARLRARGLVVTATSANRLSISVRGSAATTSTAFSTTIDRYVLRNGASEDAPTSVPHLPGSAGLVQGIVGLDTVAPTAALQIHGDARPAQAHAQVAQGSSACSAATADASANGGETPAQIAAHYGLSNFTAAGDQGSGVTVALYELEPFSASDIASYQACMGTNTTVTTESVDGGAGTGAGSGEAAMDVEDLIGLAPKASIRVYEGPQTGQGAYNTYSQIVSDDAAQIISTSWGLCEAQEGVVGARAENVLFQEAATQGQSVIAASGDDGADDCGNGSLAVDDPGSQPWVTSVGGTRFGAAGDAVWNDSSGAGGGGASQFWGRPTWQTSSEAQSGVSCGAVPGTSCREVPDISADADPNTGYTAFYRGAWRTIGGTSVSAPTVAALAALATASPACGGARLGFLSPALYADAADIHDITSGTNSFDGVTGFAATPGYDMASGLGTPTAALGPALCGDSVSLTVPGAQSWTTARSVSLAASATSAKHAALSFSATGLPAGVQINPSSGAITGTPTQGGGFTATVTALDADGGTQSRSFTATVTISRTATAAAKKGSAKSAAQRRRAKARKAARARRAKTARARRAKARIRAARTRLRVRTSAHRRQRRRSSHRRHR
jgi:subtilase family serine protease